MEAAEAIRDEPLDCCFRSPGAGFCFDSLNWLMVPMSSTFFLCLMPDVFLLLAFSRWRVLPFFSITGSKRLGNKE